MEIKDVLPPGEHRHDPYRKHLEPVTWAVSRALTHVEWIGEHWHEFRKGRNSHPDLAEAELGYLIDCQRQAMKHLERLAGLLLAGYSRDPEKEVIAELSQRFAMLESDEQGQVAEDERLDAPSS